MEDHLHPATDGDLAACGLVESGNELEQAGLSRSGATHNAEALAVVHAQVDAVECGVSAVHLASPFERDQGIFRCGRGKAHLWWL